ncbi:hypothetical protein ACF1BN_05980 [Streptomyces sp. NPDC014861]|uniref:hypothetical protein n=1 Tax=Streptomyces sp. NPDC014861 TaxID=3364923 RepID=UPI0036FF836F
MSRPLPSFPVLRGRDGAVLTAEDAYLVLDLPVEQITFTADGLGRLRAEGRTLLIELRARTGTTPIVHRIDDVDEEDARRFADRMNEALARRVDDDDVDGARFAVIRHLGPTWRKGFHRRLGRGLLAHLLALLALGVAGAVTGHGDVVAAAVVLGGFGWLCLAMGWYGAARSRRERWLRRHGVLATAVRTTGRGGYMYPDGTGAYRGFLHGDDDPALTVGFPADAPEDVLVLSKPFTDLVNSLAGPFLVFAAAVLTIALGALSAALFSGAL